MLNSRSIVLATLSLAAILLATSCDTGVGGGLPPADPKVEATQDTVTADAEPDPTATIIAPSTEPLEPVPTAIPTATPDQLPPASPIPKPADTPLPPTAVPVMPQPEIAKAPVPSELAPIGWATYHNGVFGFSVDHPQYELVGDEPDRPYFRERLYKSRAIWVSVHEVAGADPLAEFARWYWTTVLEENGLEHLASEISATEEVINGRRFLSIDYVTPADPGTACESLNF